MAAFRSVPGSWAERMEESVERISVASAQWAELLPLDLVSGPARSGAASAAPEPLQLDAYLKELKLYRAAFKAAVEALPTEAYLVRVDRNGLAPLDSNARGRAALERHYRELLAELKLSLDGVGDDKPFSAVECNLHGAARHVLLVRRPPRLSGLDARLAHAVRAWGITEKQARVLRLLVAGHANKTIAEKLQCAEVTVERHVTRMLRRTGVEKRSELVALFWASAV